MLVRREIFEEVGGLDERAFPVAFNDVDLCLRIRQLGMHVVWTAFAQLIHAESASRGKDQTPEKMNRAQREQRNFIGRWTQAGYSDLFYNCSLSTDYLSGPYGGLAMHHYSVKKRKQHLTSKALLVSRTSLK
jgi:GT2 family glycosyltransferase